jgi:hypothetical protein
MSDAPQPCDNPFNSAVENGLRALILLAEAYPAGLDIEHLMQFEYLLVHSGDAGGPDSLHPPTPLRSGELLVRRELIQAGLWLYVRKGLIEQHASAEGITYNAADEAGPFLSCFTAPYIGDLKNRARWVCDNFIGPDSQKKSVYHQNFDRWIAEFRTIERAGSRGA